MGSPYSDLPPGAYWRTGVSDRSPLDPGDLYAPKFRIGKRARIVTAGSCFAQHVGRRLSQAGFNVQDAEAPPPGFPESLAQKYGYLQFSARYGNIYTARQLVQLLQEATQHIAPDHAVWRRGDRFFDSLRPSVEPDGLPSHADVLEHRAQHLEAVRTLLAKLDVFVFTFGLTEAWVARSDGTVYPTAPGTIAGDYDPAIFAFRNFGFSETYADFVLARKIIMQQNPRCRFVVTVSPVPLTATASGQHVEVASSYSKAVLRAVCGQLREEFANVDYFPSYEVITSQSARGVYYEPNLRTVSRQGVEAAMALFMRAHTGAANTVTPSRRKTASAAAQDDVACDDALLEAFSGK